MRDTNTTRPAQPVRSNLSSASHRDSGGAKISSRARERTAHTRRSYTATQWLILRPRPARAWHKTSSEVPCVLGRPPLIARRDVWPHARSPPELAQGSNGSSYPSCLCCIRPVRLGWPCPITAAEPLYCPKPLPSASEVILAYTPGHTPPLRLVQDLGDRRPSAMR